jgi:Rieske 2Fe-2S family protein
MYDRNRILQLLDQSRPGFSLPRALYRDEDVFEFDVEQVFTRSWLLIGFEVELAEVGSYLALTVGRNPIVVIRGTDGTIRGFHNTCRHRGSQICADGKGRTSKMVCPYHMWSYDLDGRLVGAARMGGRAGIGETRLESIAVQVLAGCIYVALGPNAPDFAPFRAAVGPILEKFRFRETKLAHECTITEKANWKLAMENARECYHCPTGHPELRNTFPVGLTNGFEFGDGDHAKGYFAKIASLGFPTKAEATHWWQAGFYPLNPGIETISMDGKPLVNRRLLESSEKELGGFRWATEPNSFAHALADYAFMFSVIPVGPQETHVLSKWLVPKDAVEGVDYHLENLIETWMKTNFQDRDLTENNQRGVNSVAYKPGPYSTDAEDYVHRFTQWYVTEARAAATA